MNKTGFCSTIFSFWFYSSMLSLVQFNFAIIIAFIIWLKLLIRTIWFIMIKPIGVYPLGFELAVVDHRGSKNWNGSDFYRALQHFSTLFGFWAKKGHPRGQFTTAYGPRILQLVQDKASFQDIRLLNRHNREWRDSLTLSMRSSETASVFSFGRKLRFLQLGKRWFHSKVEWTRVESRSRRSEFPIRPVVLTSDGRLTRYGSLEATFRDIDLTPSGAPKLFTGDPIHLKIEPRSGTAVGIWSTDAYGTNLSLQRSLSHETVVQ